MRCRDSKEIIQRSSPPPVILSSSLLSSPLPSPHLHLYCTPPPLAPHVLRADWQDLQQGNSTFYWVVCLSLVFVTHSHSPRYRWGGREKKQRNISSDHQLTSLDLKSGLDLEKKGGFGPYFYTHLLILNPHCIRKWSEQIEIQIVSWFLD